MNEWEEHLTLLPEHMRDSMKRWIQFGISPGSFGLAILRNNLTESFLMADAINRQRMVDWVKFLVYHMPAGAWGSPDAVDCWIDNGGLNGNRKKE